MTTNASSHNVTEYSTINSIVKDVFENLYKELYRNNIMRVPAELYEARGLLGLKTMGRCQPDYPAWWRFPTSSATQLRFTQTP